MFMNQDSTLYNDAKINFEIQASLKATHSWIEIPNFVLINNGGRGFSVQIDPTELAPGYHFGEILGYLAI